MERGVTMRIRSERGLLVEEESLRARITKGGLLPLRFRAGRWYAAEYTDDGAGVVLMKGRARTRRTLGEVEIRRAPDDAWEVRAASRVAQDRDGQRLDYPGRIAECPEGHTRSIPSRFDAAEVVLKCGPCGRSYRLTDDR